MTPDSDKMRWLLTWLCTAKCGTSFLLSYVCNAAQNFSFLCHVMLLPDRSPIWRWTLQPCIAFGGQTRRETECHLSLVFAANALFRRGVANRTRTRTRMNFAVDSTTIIVPQSCRRSKMKINFLVSRIFPRLSLKSGIKCLTQWLVKCTNRPVMLVMLLLKAWLEFANVNMRLFSIPGLLRKERWTEWVILSFKTRVRIFSEFFPFWLALRPARRELICDNDANLRCAVATSPLPPSSAWRVTLPVGWKLPTQRFWEENGGKFDTVTVMLKERIDRR